MDPRVRALRRAGLPLRAVAAIFGVTPEQAASNPVPAGAGALVPDYANPHVLSPEEVIAVANLGKQVSVPSLVTVYVSAQAALDGWKQVQTMVADTEEQDNVFTVLGNYFVSPDWGAIQVAIDYVPAGWWWSINVNNLGGPDFGAGNIVEAREFPLVAA